MAWEILAIWAIVMATIAWFVHDERKLIANATMAQAGLFYAPPAQRNPAPHEEDTAIAEKVAAGPRVSARQGLNSAQRDFLRVLSETA